MTGKLSKRPISPHLQVYKPQLTSVMSILHRITGMANVVGLLLFSWWLISAASGVEAYSHFVEFITSGFGKFLLFGWTVAVMYHLFNGIRHLVWDTGRCLKIEQAYRAGYLVLAATFLATLLIWLS